MAHVEWEETACPLCHHGGFREVLRQPAGPNESVDHYRLVCCRSCGLGYLNPRPTLGSIGFYYPADYQPYQHKSREKPARRWSRFLGRGDAHTFLPIKPPGRVLDIGCGSGAYLARMRDLGWNVVGLDISPHGVTATRLRGIEAYEGQLPHPSIPPESVDVVNFGAVLEHVHDPHRFLAAARQTVKPGGLLVFSVPNFDSWARRFFGLAWWPLELPRHLLHFNRSTLELLVQGHELELVDVRSPAHSNWMRLSVERARQLSMTSSRTKRLLVTALRSRLLSGAATRLTSWFGRGDCLLFITRRPVEESRQVRAARLRVDDGVELGRRHEGLTHGVNRFAGLHDAGSIEVPQPPDRA
jgi:SAM-dependent methyltransferase